MKHSDCSFSKYPDALMQDNRLAYIACARTSKLQKITGAARSPVCAGLRLLKRLPLLFVQLCPKKNGAYMILPSQAANEATGAGVRPSLRCILSSKERICKTFLDLFWSLCPNSCPRRRSVLFTEVCHNEN